MTYVRALAALIIGLSPSASLPDVDMASSDRYALAQMVDGEGWHLLGDHQDLAGIALVHCAMNGITGTVDGRLKAFHGYDGQIVPLPATLAVVDLALALYSLHDVTAGSVYCVSRHDLDNAGALHKAADAELGLRNGMWGLYFFREYPLGGD